MVSWIGASPQLTRMFNQLPDTLIRSLYYQYKFRRRLNLNDPTRFTELIQQRMLKDRSVETAWTCDKLMMKEYAYRHTSRAYIPTTYWTGIDLNEMYKATLPKKWVLKPNHRSQAVLFGEGRPDLTNLKGATRNWLEIYERAFLGEWAYTQARRCFLVEEDLGNGSALDDYKFYVFGGDPHLVQVDSNRFSGHRRRFYTPNWEPLEYKNVFPMAAPQAQPRLLDTMLEAASDLGRRFDFIRVDLYEANETVYFGELTPYPEGGMKPFQPSSVDRELGGLWRTAAAGRN